MKTWMKKNSDGEVTFDLKGLTEQEAITLCNALERVIEARTMTSTDRDTLIEIVNEMEGDLFKKEKIKEQHSWYKDDKDKGEGEL